MSDLRAVIFDFDGVIVESLEVKTDAFRALFADEPDHVERVVQLHLDNLGVSRYEKFGIIYRDFLRRPLDDAETRRLDERFSELVYERILECELVPGARELLDALASEVPLFVASATPEPELARIVAARGLSAYFRRLRGSPTPKPQIVSELLRDYKLVPGETLFVGDAISDLQAAAANGLAFVGRVPHGERNPFPDSVATVRDLGELRRRWSEITAPSSSAA